jgi:voltage-gated potassium channel
VSANQTPWRIVLAALAVVSGGTYGFMQTEHLSLGDALYQTILIMLRHYGQVELHETWARVLNIVLILCSLVLLGYLLKYFAEYIIGVSDSVRKRRLQAKVNKMKHHYIVCGLGRVGSQVAREMGLEDVEFVGIDRDQAKVGEAIATGYVAFQGDSSSEEVLKQAGIDHAAGLVASLGDDSANLLVVLAARAMNPKLYIVARANRAENEVKLKRAGADRVALPYQIGGYHMASMALRPSVVDYMDIVGSTGSTSDLQVEEMVVSEHSRLAGHRLGKTLTEGEIGATVIAINGSDGTSRVRPTGNEVIYPGDRLIVLGAKTDLTKASDLVQ